MREREVPLICSRYKKNKHVLIIEIFASQILSLLVLKEIKRENIYIYIFKICREGEKV